MSLEGFVNVALRLLRPTNSSRFLSPPLWKDGRFWPTKGSLDPKAMLLGHNEVALPRPPFVQGNGRKGPTKACLGDVVLAPDHGPAETSITSKSDITATL